MNNKADQFWVQDSTATWWIGQDSRYKALGGNKMSEDYILDNMPKDIKTVLDVGAGLGRLIALFKDVEAHTVDINKKLCELVKQKYPHIQTHNCPITNIDLPDNSIDFVYTFQVLQHVSNDQISQALHELLRVAKDRIWLFEGYVPGAKQGAHTQPDNGGSFCYYHDSFFKCEVVEQLERKLRLYKIRKRDNLSIEVVI